MIGAAEITLRLAEPYSPFLRRVLHRHGEAPRYAEIESLDELLASTPFHPGPFVDWGGFRLESHGFRTHEYGHKKPAGIHRIVVIGDSFAFDSGFVPWDQIWHHLAGRRLEAEKGMPVEVINLGVPAVGPGFYLRMFELEGRRLAPDVVIVSLFVGNDLIDEAGARGSLLQRWSRTWRLVSLLLRHPRTLLSSPEPQSGPGGFPVGGAPYDPEEPLNDEETFLRIAGESAEIFSSEARPEIEASLADTVSMLERMNDEVREVGARLVVVLIPDRIQLEEDLRRSVVSPDEQYDFDWIQRTLGERLDAAGIANVDLLPAFRAASPDAKLYRFQDTHWSAAGNALAADRIAPALRDPGPHSAR